GDEGMLAGYSDVRFTAPIRAGDVVEVTGTVTRVGNRSRTVELSCAVVCRARPERSPSAAEVLDPPVVAVVATATVVVPLRGSRVGGYAGPRGSMLSTRADPGGRRWRAGGASQGAGWGAYRRCFRW